MHTGRRWSSHHVCSSTLAILPCFLPRLFNQNQPKNVLTTENLVNATTRRAYYKLRTWRPLRVATVNEVVTKIQVPITKQSRPTAKHARRVTLRFVLLSVVSHVVSLVSLWSVCGQSVVSLVSLWSVCSQSVVPQPASPTQPAGVSPVPAPQRTGLRSFPSACTTTNRTAEFPQCLHHNEQDCGVSPVPAPQRTGLRSFPSACTTTNRTAEFPQCLHHNEQDCGVSPLPAPQRIISHSGRTWLWL